MSRTGDDALNRLGWHDKAASYPQSCPADSSSVCDRPGVEHESEVLLFDEPTSAAGS
jgi:ABC-type histidine transport system ATPase subunit